MVEWMIHENGIIDTETAKPLERSLPASQDLAGFLGVVCPTGARVIDVVLARLRVCCVCDRPAPSDDVGFEWTDVDGDFDVKSL